MTWYRAHILLLPGSPPSLYLLVMSEPPRRHRSPCLRCAPFPNPLSHPPPRLVPGPAPIRRRSCHRRPDSQRWPSSHRLGVCCRLLVLARRKKGLPRWLPSRDGRFPFGLCRCSGLRSGFTKMLGREKIVCAYLLGLLVLVLFPRF